MGTWNGSVSKTKQLKEHTITTIEINGNPVVKNKWLYSNIK